MYFGTSSGEVGESEGGLGDTGEVNLDETEVPGIDTGEVLGNNVELRGGEAILGEVLGSNVGEFRVLAGVSDLVRDSLYLFALFSLSCRINNSLVISLFLSFSS